MDILLLLGQVYGLLGSSWYLCLGIEIIFCNLYSCVSIFLSESLDDVDSGKAAINKMLQREAVKKRDMIQRQLMMRNKWSRLLRSKKTKQGVKR